MKTGPDARGRFGIYGGRYVPETLMAPLLELEEAYESCRRDASFQSELDRLLRDYVGRPTPLTRARKLEQALGGLRIHLKREDLNHTGAHKINNTVGQALLARRMGKKRVIAETGAGQHGVATATVAALLDLECVIYMGEEDMARQALNVVRMRLLGAKVVPVSSGTRTLKDAINEAMRDWVTHCRSTHYVLGSVLGAHPYPMMVRDFQSVIGREARAQYLASEGTLPDLLVACVGGGSNSLGLFTAFLEDPGVEMVGVEAEGEGLGSGRHAARFPGGSPGVLHGTYTFVLQDAHGNISPTHSVSAGLDYPAVGPEHARLRDLGRVRYETARDEEALKAFHLLARAEGILPALEPAHALGWLMRVAPQLRAETRVLLNLSGRGDKDVDQAAARLGAET
ncbi:MAG TPA: tryptophan synthase subunit beta [Candidatus Polarisedimenticolia bacterium]|jgi:tryptophan synthase beta chain|nr:tryptophan synthase subunit beta [Candidatus Polarisedimenticolia bacterium]